MTFGINLKKLRIAKGFTNVSQFAKALNINLSTYHNYEKRNSLPPEDVIIRIANKLSVTVDELFGYQLKTKPEQSDIEKALATLKQCGFIFKRDKMNKEVVVSANHDIASIPDSVIIEMVNNSQKSVDLALMRIYEYSLFALLMNDIIRYGKFGEYHGKIVFGKPYRLSETRKISKKLSTQRETIAKIFSNDINKKLNYIEREDENKT